MKTDNIFLMPFFVLALLMLFLLPVSSDAKNGADAYLYENVDRASADSEVAPDYTVVPDISQLYYIVNDNMYVVMQKPMVYGAFAVAPVIVPYFNENAVHVETADLSSNGDVNVSVDNTGGESEGDTVALNMHFRGIFDKQSETDFGTETARDSEDLADPLEHLNRAFFTFNDRFYFWALKPLSTVYGQIVPEWGRTRVSNFFENIKSPIRLVSSLLQFKMNTFGAEFARFVLNSTVGVAGLFDIASRHPELSPAEEDLGQTLGSYGIGEGFYLVLPLLGPTSLRDSVGTAGELFLNPVQYITPFRDALAVRAFDTVNETSFKIGNYEDIKESAIDPYISIRDIYKQYRRHKVRE